VGCHVHEREASRVANVLLTCCLCVANERL
jgi:hypothetical protein